jgi:7,8-dihydro-6-hydroxymethylpterin-pyrophosphokinase
MEWIGWVRCEKSRRDFVARTFPLIALVHPVLHRVSCCYETIPNAPKHYEAHQNMSLGSNGVDWVSSLRKIPTWLCGTNFCINCNSSSVLHRVSSCYETIPNAPKHYEAHQNMSLGSNMADQVRSSRKTTTWLRGTNYCMNCTSSVCFATSFMQLRNDPKCSQILRNGPKH